MEKLKFGTVNEEFSLTGEDIKLLNTKKSWIETNPDYYIADCYKPSIHILDEAVTFPFKKDYSGIWNKIVKPT